MNTCINGRGNHMPVTLLLTSTLLLICAGGIFATPAAETPQSPLPSARTVTVIGEGVIDVEPDLAIVRIGVDSVAATVDEALAESRRAMNDMITALSALGVAGEDMQTANYSFSFDRSMEPGFGPGAGTAPGAYRANNMLTVTIRDLGSTAAIIDAAVTAGANQMWGVEFGISDPASVETDALERATLDARERAAYLAGLSGLELGEIVSISEVLGSGYPGPVALRAEGLGGGATNLNPGLIRYSSRIQVVYTLVPEESAE